MAGKYASNALWPAPNQWTWQPHQAQVAKHFHASDGQVLAAHEKEQQRLLRKESKKLKAQLFQAIIDVRTPTALQMGAQGCGAAVPRSSCVPPHLTPTRPALAIPYPLSSRNEPACRKLLRNTLLLERHTPYGATPLILAAAVGDTPVLSLLLDRGASIAAQDKVGASALITAAFKGHAEALQVLLASKQGGNVGREYLLRQCTLRGETAAMAAAKMGHLDCLKLLLEAGGDVTSVDKDGADALALAANLDRTEVLKVLVHDHHVSADRLDNLGRTPLMRAAAGAARQAVELLLSLEPQVELHTLDNGGRSALHHACEGGDVFTIEALSAAGLVVAQGDPEGPRLLNLACATGHVEAVQWLLDHEVGTAALLADGGENPMFHAAKHERYRVIDALLAAGARIDVRDDKERTPLAIAALFGHTALARHLVERGANMLITDLHGHVPRQLAQMGHHADTARLLSDLASAQLMLADDAVSAVSGHRY